MNFLVIWNGKKINCIYVFMNSELYMSKSEIRVSSIKKFDFFIYIN